MREPEAKNKGHAVNASPLISVIMPYFNAERYLSQAIESIVHQSLGDFEFLLLDDGSTDRSTEIVRGWLGRDSRSLLVVRENRGVSASRNELLKLARGEFIAVMDADDLSLPRRFEIQIEFLRRHPQVSAVSGAHGVIDDRGRYLTRLDAPLEDEEIQQALLAGSCSMCHPGAMIRREPLVQAGGYDESLESAIDIDLWLRLGEKGELANVPDAVIQYRLHTTSLSERRRAQQDQNIRTACERAWARRGLAGHFVPPPPSRPSSDMASRHAFWLRYGWWAFQSGEGSTARVYAWRAVITKPLSRESWKLFYCSHFKTTTSPETQTSP